MSCKQPHTRYAQHNEIVLLFSVGGSGWCGALVQTWWARLVSIGTLVQFQPQWIRLDWCFGSKLVCQVGCKLALWFSFIGSDWIRFWFSLGESSWCDAFVESRWVWLVWCFKRFSSMLLGQGWLVVLLLTLGPSNLLWFSAGGSDEFCWF